MIFFNGKSSDDFSLFVSRYPARVIPARKSERISVPGRSGDLLIAQDAWDNYGQVYEVYISAEKITMPVAAHAVAGWLCGAPGYCRLQDDYDRDCYRMASFSGGAEIENILNRFGRATIEFNCKPQSFLLAGDAPIDVRSGETLYTPTGFPAMPKIRVYGSGEGGLSIGGAQVRFLSITDGMVLDSEVQNAYLGTENLNGDIAADSFPVLRGGENAVSFSGGVTGIEITPRWWTI